MSVSKRNIAANARLTIAESDDLQKNKHSMAQVIKRQLRITYDNMVAYFISNTIDLTPDDEDVRIQFKHQGHAVGHLMGYIKASLRFALYVTLFGILFFGVWSGLAPLDSSSVAPGTVILSHRKDEIKHLEGGVVKKIFVQEGDRVKKNQVLIALDDVHAKTQIDTIKIKLYTEKAGEARLISERNRLDKIIFPEQLNLAAADNVEIEKALETQANIFQHSRRLLQSQLDTLDKQIIQVGELVKALKAQNKSFYKQQELSKQEVAYKSKLFEQGLLEKERFIASQSQLERIGSEYNRLLGEIAAKSAEISGLQIRKISLEQERDERIAKELKEIRAQIAELQERYNDVKTVLDRTAITSPSDGTVTDLRINTVDGIISPGQHLMYIVPEHDTLVVEAMVNPNDIDRIAVGQKAKVQLTAYKARLVPRVDGVVTYVSADVVDQQSYSIQQMPASYMARIEIPQSSLDNLTEKVRLQPGMQAQIFIVTGESTFLQYLLSPIIDSFHRAFIEK